MPLTALDLTPEQAEQISFHLRQILANGFGDLTLRIERGKLTYIIPAPSIPVKKPGTLKAPIDAGKE
jgi:hypothetical protein